MDSGNQVNAEDYRQALQSIKRMAQLLMDESRPNSNRYDWARQEAAWADRKLMELSRR